MKIYNEIVFDVDGNVVYEDSYEYSGDVILCQEEDDNFNLNLDFGNISMINPDNWMNRFVDEPQGSDIQANAAPSLPSISNVGSIAPTGVVNWNAIPGGFQPLPQTAGGRKKLYQLSKFHGGINQKSSPRDIADFECQEAINVTVSQVGRIKLLGDCLNTNNSITTEDSQKADRGAAGYGLFQFTAPAATNGTAGEYVVTLAPSGDEIDAHDSTGTTDSWITYGVTDDHDVAHVIYAAGNGVYANDANFRTSSDNPRKANIYVYREDAGSSQTVSGWKEGKALIDSPTYDIAAAGSMAAGDVKVVHSAETASVAGTMIVDCTPTGTGTWGAGGATTYYFYCSWLFDGGCETGLTSCGTDDGTGTSDGIAFTDNTLQLNISLMHTPHASNNTELGGDKRIEGGRIYFKESGTAERWLLAEFNLVDGVKGALDSTFTPWTESSDVYSHTTIIFVNPPEVYSYASLNAYYANEAYGESPDINDDDATGPTAHDVRYKTAVVGSGGIVFIGNVKFKGKHMPDSMMFSMPGKPGVFPKFNTFDSPSSDGSPITALAAFKDTILQFKENALYVINVSNPAQFYAQASFRDCGVFNPCQVFTTSFGVIFANQIGCFIYAGGKVISLTSGKFDFTNWDLPSDEGSSIGADGTGVPCVGYDPRSQSIVVLKDINDDSEDTGAFVYNMVTQSWTEGSSMITNANTNRHTNFIITSGGYLSILRDNSTSLLNYNHDMQTGTNSYASAQSIEYITKDLDFGLPSQTKKIFKVYVTYKGDCDGISVYFRADGNSTDRQFNSTNTPLSDVGSTLTTVTLTPTTASQAKDIKSFALKFTGSVGVDASDSFEINDISILYRVRPIK